METVIGIGIWVIIFLVWYVRTYPERVKGLLPTRVMDFRWPRRRRTVRTVPAPASASSSSKDFKSLVETVEHVCAMDRFAASDAASMVQAVTKLLEIEPSSGQIWEAYALDSLESAEIICDDCKIPVDKIIKKTGIRIQCEKCGKWLALKNSKVTIIDPNRPDLEEWEKYH